MTTVIFGGSGGIGSAIARRIVARGGHIHLVARDADRLEVLAKETGASFTAADVLDPDTFVRVASAIKAPVEGLVYAVGSIELRPLIRFAEDDFIRDFRLNASGAAVAVKTLLPALQEAGSASIVLFSSVAASQGFPAHASIGMAKAAVEGLTLALAAELAPSIRVNCVAPSLTMTPLAKSLTGSPQMADAIAQLHALRRLGEPADIASLVDFLLTAGADWITGQVIGVDGGRSRLRTKG